MPKNKKGKRVGIVGAGNVGSTVAYSLAVQGACHEIILRDNKVDIAKGKALDMSQAAQSIRSHTVVSVAETMADLKDCDVVVVTEIAAPGETITSFILASIAPGPRVRVVILF